MALGYRINTTNYLARPDISVRILFYFTAADTSSAAVAIGGDDDGGHRGMKAKK